MQISMGGFEIINAFHEDLLKRLRLTVSKRIGGILSFIFRACRMYLKRSPTEYMNKQREMVPE